MNQIIIKAIIATVHGNIDHPRRSVWRAKMKVAAMKLAISEIRSQICHSNVKILVKWIVQNTTLTSLLDYLLRTIGEGSEKEGFLMTLTKTCSQWLKFWLVAQTCVSKTSFAFSNWQSLIMRRACGRETMTGIYPNHFLLSSLYSLNGNRHLRFWLPHRNFQGFLRVPMA